MATVSLFLAASGGIAQDGAGAPLSIEEVVKLHNAGFSDDVIVTKIRRNGKAFNLSTDELLDLRKAGLSDQVVRYLLDPSQPWTPAPAAAPAPAPAAVKQSRQFPPDENAALIPAEPGLYRVRNGKPAAIEPKLLLIAGGGGGKLEKILKSKTTAYLPGAKAAARMTPPIGPFYLRLPEGKGVEEIVLLALDRKGERREAEIGPDAKKQELKPAAIRPFDSVEVGPRLFRVTPSELAQGEYLFFQVGSAEPAKGSAGKGFDFGVDPKLPGARPAK